MGYLTTIIIHNDALGAFEKKPKEFAEALFKGIDRANYEHKEVNVGFEGYCNYISVMPSRHADDETVYVHTGNTVFNLNSYNRDFEELAQCNPEIALDFIKRAERILKTAKEYLKNKPQKI